MRPDCARLFPCRCRKSFHLVQNLEKRLIHIIKTIVDESSLVIFNKSILSTDYTGQGVDQLQKVIDTIKANPEDRRIILCAWNAKGDASASSSDLVLMSFCRFKLKCSRPQTCPSWLCHPVTLCVSSMCATVSCPVSCTSARVIWASGCPSISPVMHFLRT